MLKETENTVFSEPPINEQKEYKIAPNDAITFKFYKNNGFEILGGDGVNASQLNIQSQIASGAAYTVELDGLVKLPFLGKVQLSGLTLRQAEAKLEQMYDTIFVDPFILLSVTNRRAIVSPGDGTSKVISLNQNNVSVLEAISQVGGIAIRGKAKNIKLIRRVDNGHEIYKLDLSTSDGLAMADLPVQANDIIYVEPRKNYAGELVKELAPYISVISSALLLLTVTKVIK